MRLSFISRAIEFSLRHSRVVVLATFALTLAFGYFATRVRINPDFTSLLPDDAEVNALLKEYGGGQVPPDLLIFAVEAKPGSQTLFNSEQLSAFSDALAQISALPGVQSSLTPFNLVAFGREGGRLVVRQMSEAGLAPEPGAVEEFRDKLRGTRYANNLVVSRDGSMLIAYFPTEKMSSFRPFMESVDGIASTLKAKGLTVYVTGTIPLSVRTEFHLGRDGTRLLAFAAIIIILSYAASFRSLRALILPLLSTLFGTVWAVGFMGLLGYPLSLITIVTPALVLIFGNEYSIYTTSEYLRVARDEALAEGWIGRAARNITTPIAMAALTTVVGFLSLMVTSIRETRQFALSASFGSLSCGFLAVFFLPAMYSLMKPPVVRIHKPGGAFDRFMRAVARFAYRAPAVILVIILGTAGLFLLTVRLLTFNTDPASYFPQNDPVILDMDSIYRKAGGYEQVSVSFDAPGEAPSSSKGYFLSAESLAKVEAVERALLALPDISYAVSLPDLLRDINVAAGGKDEIPANRAFIAMFSSLLASAGSDSATDSVLGNLVSPDFSRVTLHFRIHNSSTGRYMDEDRFRELLASMEKILAENPIDAKPVIWGDLLRNLAFADSLRRFLLISLAVSVLSILALTIFVFRSPLVGFYPLVPLSVGILLSFSLMALTRIPLDMTTIMVSNIAIGVGIDGAIYVVIQFKRKLALTPDAPLAALEETMAATGHPILLSSLSIILALLSFATATFRPVVYFGMLVLFALSATMLGTLVVLPSLLAVDARARLARRKKRAGSVS